MITVHRSNVYKGFSAYSRMRSGVNKISIYCTWKGKYYVESAKHDTFTKFSIDNFNPAKKTAEVSVEGKFVNIDALNDFIVIPESTIKITGKYFDNLTKKT